MKENRYITFFEDPIAIKLVTAVLNSDKKMLSDLSIQRANFNVVGKYDNTPLRIAIKLSKENVTQWLLEYGADPNFRTASGTVAAKYAAKHQNSRYLRLLLDAGLNPNIKFSDQPIMFYTIEASRWEQYDMLVSAGADILTTKTGDNSTVALYMAMQFEYKRLKQLIEDGADITTVSNSGLSVVGNVAKMQQRFSGSSEHSAYKMRVEILEMLCSKGIEVPQNTPGVKCLSDNDR